MTTVSSARNSVVSLVSTTGSGITQTRDSRRVETKLLEDEGVIIPSSSSKDDDILSESSDDIETIAMQTLEHIREDVGESEGM